MSKDEKIMREIKEVEEEVNNYIHEISDIKVPTDKEFNKHKKKVSAKVIKSGYYTGISATDDIVYDVIFEYAIDNVIYKSRMQTLNNYVTGRYVDIYYYKKDPSFIKEINYNSGNAESFITKILVFSILLVLASILFVTLYY